MIWCKNDLQNRLTATSSIVSLPSSFWISPIAILNLASISDLLARAELLNFSLSWSHSHVILPEVFPPSFTMSINTFPAFTISSSRGYRTYEKLYGTLTYIPVNLKPVSLQNLPPSLYSTSHGMTQQFQILSREPSVLLLWLVQQMRSQRYKRPPDTTSH